MTKPNMVPIESLLRHDDFIRGLARNLLGRDSRAEDVAQDAWLAAARDGPSSEAQARGWFGRVVRNKVASLRRKDASAARYRDRAPTPAGVPEPAELLDREAMRSHVVAALLALDPIYRDCLVLRFYEGLKPREIAARLDLPVETVRTRTRRGLERMRAELDERCGPRRRWLAALLPLAGRWPTPSWNRWIPMAAAAAVVVLAVGCVLWLAGDATLEEDAAVVAITEAPAPALATRGTKQKPEPQPEAPVMEEVSKPAPWHLGGRLVWQDDKTPAADVPVEVRLMSGRKTLLDMGVHRTSADGTFTPSLMALQELSPATWSAAALHINTVGYHSGGWPTGTSVPLRRLRAGAKTQVLPVQIGVWHPDRGHGHLMGVLLGVDGKRVINANIAAWRGEPDALTLVKQGFVNAIGEFGVPVGSSIYYSSGKGITDPEQLTIIAEVPGVGRAVRTGIQANPTTNQWLGTLQLEPHPERTRITFELGDGTPLAGMEVHAVPGTWKQLIAAGHEHAPWVHGDHTGTWRTDEDGAITLAAQDRRPWSVWLVRPNRPPSGKPEDPDIEVTPGDEDVRVVIPGHVLRVRVRDDTGAVAAGAKWEANGWPADRRDAADRVWRKVKPQHTALPYPDDDDEPTWTMEDDASLEGGPAEGTLEDILLLGEPGSEWIVCAWTSGFYRGMARVRIPTDARRSEAELRMRRVAPGTLRIDAFENGEASPAEFRYYIRLEGTDDVYGYGTLRHGHTFKDLIPGRYDFRLQSGTHYVAKRYYNVNVPAGGDAILKLKVKTGGTLRLHVEVPGPLEGNRPRRAYVRAWNVDKKTYVGSTRFTLMPAKDGTGITVSFKHHGDRTEHPQKFLPGLYRLKVNSDNWESETVHVEIREDTITTAHVRLDVVEK